MRPWPTAFILLALGLLAACEAPGPTLDPIFVDGRAAATRGDSVLAITVSAHPGVLLRHRRSGVIEALGATALRSPLHIQSVGEDWYVSDSDDGRPLLITFGPNGQPKSRIDLDGIASAPHQFAVLPNRSIIIEAPDGRLLALRDNSVAEFAESGAVGQKTGLLVAASGGAAHAVPDEHITLYNKFGNIRWRVDWPWASTAFVTDFSVDFNGRVHLIAGVPRDGTFVVYTLSIATGEVIRWSVPGPRATFVVDYLGNIKPDDRETWVGQR